MHHQVHQMDGAFFSFLTRQYETMLFIHQKRKQMLSVPLRSFEIQHDKMWIFNTGAWHLSTSHWLLHRVKMMIEGIQLWVLLKDYAPLFRSGFGQLQIDASVWEWAPMSIGKINELSRLLPLIF